MRRLSMALLLLGGCADDGSDPMHMGSDASTAADPDSTTAMPPGATTDVLGSSGLVDGSGTTLPDSSGGDDDSSGGNVEDGVFATATFTIPAGTVVQEFSFAAQADTIPGVLDGRTLVVAVTDLSHPRRNQPRLCPASHPLDDCATVDYGAFGDTHDNRVTFEGPEGPWSVHMYKDRTLQVDPEPLAATE